MSSESYARAEEAIEAYLDRLIRRGRRPTTVRSYGTALRSVTRFLEEQGMEYMPERIGEDEIMRIVLGYGASEATVHNYITILAPYLEWYGNGIVKETGVLWNEPAHPNARWITPEEFARVLREATDPTDRIIVMLSAYAGMRRSEIAALRLEDIFSDRMVITGKGHGRGKQRVIPLSDRIAAEITRYRSWRDEAAQRGCERLVVGHNARTGRTEGLTPGSISRRAQKLCGRAGVDASLHSFRRYFATQIWHSMPDKDVKVLQELMGHTTPIMTMRYIRLQEETLLAAINRL